MVNNAQRIKLINQSYDLGPVPAVDDLLPLSGTPYRVSSTGLMARAHFSTITNTLVITYTGTNDPEDRASNQYIAGFGTGAAAEQVPGALAYAQAQISLANSLYGSVNVEFVGHSLGGYLATVVRNSLNVGQAHVFNAPGVGEGAPPEIFDSNIFYYYSDPTTWFDQLATIFGIIDVSSSDIHNTGTRASDNIFFYMDAEGHPAAPFLEAIENGDEPIDLDEFIQVWATALSSSVALGNPPIFALTRYQFDHFLDRGNGPEDIRAIVSDIALGRNCFLAGTPIAMWPVDPSLKPGPDGVYDQAQVRAGLWTKPIEEVSRRDLVVSYDDNGNPVPGKVDKLFTNTTSEFVVLEFSDGRDSLTVTPGHRFLTEAGDYMEIGHMLRLGGGTARVVDLDGSIVEAFGEVIAYSAETAHMFPETQTKTIAFAGNTVLKEQVEAGWQTYNFEVREYHNYVAGGIRVHNDSILSTLNSGDELVALNNDLSDAVLIQGDKVIVRIGEPDQNGNTEISLQSGFKDTFIGGTKIKDATDTVAALISSNPGLANNPEALLQQLLTSGLTPDTDLVGLFVNGFGLVQGVSNPLVGDGRGGSDTRGRHVVRERLA